MRGRARDHDAWARLTADDSWRWSACLPCFIRHEDHGRGAVEHDAAFEAHHGVGGDWRVDRQR